MRVLKVGKLGIYLHIPIDIIFKIHWDKHKVLWSEWIKSPIDPMPKESKKGGWMYYSGWFTIRWSDW